MSGGIGLLACRLMALAVFGIGALAGVPADAASISLPDIVKRMYVDSEFAAKTPAGSGKKRFSTEGDTELAFDYKKVTFNMDVNLTIPANTGQLEQAYISMPLVQGLSLTGGVMNNPLGWEQEDAPDRDQISHGQLWTLLDGQTSLSGNNVGGGGVPRHSRSLRAIRRSAERPRECCQQALCGGGIHLPPGGQAGPDGRVCHPVEAGCQSTRERNPCWTSMPSGTAGLIPRPLSISPATS